MKGNIIIGFLLVFFLFVPIEHLFALKKSQKTFRKGWVNDVIHFFLNHLLIKIGLVICIIPIAILLKPFISPALQTAISKQPHWVQFFIALMVTEVFHYLGHRLMHEVPQLWRFHSIHHSIEEMDWLASARLHPVDQIITKTITIIPLYILGFSKATFGIFLSFSIVYALFIHANVKIPMWFLSYFIVTPQFHHWHHSSEQAAHNKNYAGIFPFIDMIFGSFYLPNQMPEKYGVSEPIPNNYLKQMIYPFQN
jgi:sterol desaturase/sphingolipid hydroxylase (fatty acid hydroxylase superfamily)